MEFAVINEHYRMGIASSLSEIGQNNWNQLIGRCKTANPFLSYVFLDALHTSGSASKTTGWHPCFITIWHGDTLEGACPLYQKSHSYGEYVFDWAWADAYQRYGHAYYPKLLSAIPFTPVSGSRIISSSAQVRAMILNALKQLTCTGDFSSCHVLFPEKDEAQQLEDAGFLIRTGVQFHWINRNFASFDAFLETLEKKKRKNIRSERKKVQEQGISFLHVKGSDMQEEDWIFFKHCYDLTYRNHHSSPYLNLDFFLSIGASMPEHIHLIFAVQNHQKVAASLLIHDCDRLYGRYWGATGYFPCLHFETAYYQAIDFCIDQKIKIFEGGAQGEHKMARGFLPSKTWSAHLLAKPEFSKAVEHFLQRETKGIELYIDELNDRQPYKSLSPDD
jgi:predicted N-acyltransferase